MSHLETAQEIAQLEVNASRDEWRETLEKVRQGVTLVINDKDRLIAVYKFDDTGVEKPASASADSLKEEKRYLLESLIYFYRSVFEDFKQKRAELEEILGQPLTVK